MTLPEFLATVPDLTDADAGDAWNASPHRFDDSYMTPEGLIRGLGQQLADVVLGSLTAAAAESPSLGFVLDRLRTSERGINLGDPATHAMLRQLGAHPNLRLTPAQAEQVIETTATDPAVAADEVAGVRAEMAESAVSAARDAARGEARRALDAAGNAAVSVPDPTDRASVLLAAQESLAAWVASDNNPDDVVG